jgi:hypothetical protein
MIARLPVSFALLIPIVFVFLLLTGDIEVWVICLEERERLEREHVLEMALCLWIFNRSLVDPGKSYQGSREDWDAWREESVDGDFLEVELPLLAIELSPHFNSPSQASTDQQYERHGSRSQRCES